MSLGSWLLIALLGGAGAIARVEVGAAVSARLGRVWLGTLSVNLLGAFLLGIAHAALSDRAATVIGVGLIGAFTTFSTWMLEAERATTASVRALVFLVPLVLGLLAVAAGNAVGSL